MAPRPQDLTGQRFGRLLVIERASKPKTSKVRTDSGWWRCMCSCGQFHTTYITSLKSGATQSCGCLARELSSIRNSTHGQKGTLTYSSWQAMRTRCLNPNAANFERYGGRGITICAEWGDFKKFLEDMSERPSADYTLDRVDPDLGYSLDNCRWASWDEQAVNRRNSLSEEEVQAIKLLCHVGQSDDDVAERYTISPATVRRIRLGQTYSIFIPDDAA